MEKLRTIRSLLVPQDQTISICRARIWTQKNLSPKLFLKSSPKDSLLILEKERKGNRETQKNQCEICCLPHAHRGGGQEILNLGMRLMEDGTHNLLVYRSDAPTNWTTRPGLEPMFFTSCMTEELKLHKSMKYSLVGSGSRKSFIR